MPDTHHRNATYGFIAGLQEVLHSGQRLVVRGSEVMELRNHLTVIENPLERCIISPKRNNNIFATIAETAWVMAGRDDLAYLSHYLPRAAEFSDDGKTWRAAYGPRLRNWHGVDQVKRCIPLFQKDLYTRRAVMAIFDPAIDYQDGKDIPCNNWLHWLVRDNRLNLSVSLRSNDAIWGFSGINSFEWSVLQEMLAHWIGVEVGDVTFFAGSFHVYMRHHDRAMTIVRAFPGRTWYEAGNPAPRFATSMDRFDRMLERWFTIESTLRIAPHSADHAIAHFPDPLFRQFLTMLQLYNGLLNGWEGTRLAHYLAAMPENDLTAAAYEYLARARPEVIEGSVHPAIHSWLTTYSRSRKTAAPGHHEKL